MEVDQSPQAQKWPFCKDLKENRGVFMSAGASKISTFLLCGSRKAYIAWYRASDTYEVKIQYLRNILVPVTHSRALENMHKLANLAL